MTIDDFWEAWSTALVRARGGQTLSVEELRAYGPGFFVREIGMDTEEEE